MFEIVARELRAKLLGRQRGLADTTQQHSAAGVEGAGGTGGHGCGGHGRRRGLADTTQQHSATGVEGAGGTGGHGCGGRGRRRGQGGLRDDALSHTQQHSATSVEGAGRSGGHGRASRSTTPSRRLACGDLAGGRARRIRPDGAQNTRAQANRPYSPPPPGSGRPV